MRVIAKSTLRSYWEKHADAKTPLEAWHYEILKANWQTPNDIKAKYQSVDFLKNNRVVFNIGGNKYRLIVAVNYHLKIVYIRFVGTHAEYDKINAEEI